MNEPAPSWDYYRTFLEVVREGSLSGAARTLGLTQPTAGRHIEAIEKALGLTLFARSRRGLDLTPAARELVPFVEAMLASHNALLRAASGEPDMDYGTVRITASEIISHEVLPPILADLYDRYPKLTVEILSSNRMENLLQREIDVAVRMTKPEQDLVIAKRVGITKIGLYAHRAYLQKRGAPQTTVDLDGHRLIGFDRDTFFRRAVETSPKINMTWDAAFRCDSHTVQLAAIRAGIGIGGCQIGIAERDENLVRVLPDEFVFDLHMWVAMHEKLKSVRRVRLVFDALCGGLSKYLESTRPKPPRPQIRKQS